MRSSVRPSCRPPAMRSSAGCHTPNQGSSRPPPESVPSAVRGPCAGRASTLAWRTSGRWPPHGHGSALAREPPAGPGNVPARPHPPPLASTADRVRPWEAAPDANPVHHARFAPPRVVPRRGECPRRGQGEHWLSLVYWVTPCHLSSDRMSPHRLDRLGVTLCQVTLRQVTLCHPARTPCSAMVRLYWVSLERPCLRRSRRDR